MENNAVATPVVEATSTSQNESEAVVEATEEPKVFDADYVSKLRGEAAKYRTQAKELAEKAKKFDEHTDSQKSEQEKLTDDLRAATESRAQLESVERQKSTPEQTGAGVVGGAEDASIEGFLDMLRKQN